VTGLDIRATADRLWWDAKNVVSRYPSVAIPIARRRGHGVVVDAGTDVVIEGYPRSANSFAVAAFDMPQARPLRTPFQTGEAAGTRSNGDRCAACAGVRQARRTPFSGTGLWSFVLRCSQLHSEGERAGSRRRIPIPLFGALYLRRHR
jgi:hypothetical protein